MSHTNPPKEGLDGPNTSDEFGKPSAEALRLGYEPDGYHALSVVSVPVLVIVFFLLAFGTTTVIFYFVNKTMSSDPSAHPMAAERNAAPLNDRLKRIGNGSETDQPRLEPLRTRSGNSRAITRPEDPNGENPPYMYPEDNRADPARTPELFRIGWADKDHHFAHVPLNDVMAGQVANLFPVQKNGSKPLSSSHRPTAANAGQGAEHSQAEMPKLPVVAEAKHDDHKDDHKKEEPKKETPKEAPKEAPKGEVKK